MIGTVRARRRWLLLLAILVAAAARYAVIGVRTPDQAIYLVPWVARAGALGSGYLKHSFTNYAPFYEHVLALLALFPGSEVLRVKLSSMLFDVLLAASVTTLVPRERRTLAFCATLLLPTIICNSAALAQCDSIYACAIVLALAAAIAERPVWTMLAFSVALAIKLQAVMFAPVLLLLVLQGRQPLWTFLLIPVAYCAFAAPMLAAGRSIDDIAFVYLRQFDFFNSLSLNAPNPWLIGGRIVPYRVGVLLGLPCAGLVIAGAVLALWRSGIARRGRPEGLLLAAAILLIAVPYVTPKMHDRYFFLVDPVLVALLAHNRRYLAPLCLAQTASFLAYVSFPIGQSEWGAHHWLLGANGSARRHLHVGWDVFPLIGAVLMGAALVLLARRAVELWRADPDRSTAGLRALIAGRLSASRGPIMQRGWATR